jgi:hypothetical protein
VALIKLATKFLTTWPTGRLLGIGNVLPDMFKYQEALVERQKALQLLISYQHLDVITLLMNAWRYQPTYLPTYQQQGKYEEPLEMITNSLEIKTRIYGGDSHADVAISYLNTGKS